MTVRSAEEFFAVLEKSNLLIPAQLAQARSEAAASDNPRTIAKNLAHQNLITRWQAGQMLAGRSSFYLGKYRLIELLGRGGIGSAFLAEHVTMNRRVVLRVLSRQVSMDPTLLDHFLAEARGVSALDHPNIVHAYSIDNEAQRYYLVMEYVEGIDVEQLVKRDGPLDCDRAVEYICQAADGLDYAHQRNMSHGNLKPSNLLVNAQGVVKILDLGLARFAAGEAKTAGQGQPALGSIDDLARRADICALGCTFYFLLTGQPPFPQETPSAGAAEQPTQEPPDVCQQRPNVPAELAAICQKMMAKKPANGYATAAEASQALVQWRASMPRLKRATPFPRAKPLEEP